MNSFYSGASSWDRDHWQSKASLGWPGYFITSLPPLPSITFFFSTENERKSIPWHFYAQTYLVTKFVITRDWIHFLLRWTEREKNPRTKVKIKPQFSLSDYLCVLCSVCCPWGCKESDMTGQLTHTCTVVSDSVMLWTVACQALQSTGFSRQEYWSGIPFPSPGNLPNPGIKPVSPVSSAFQRFFTHWTTWEVLWLFIPVY